MMAGFIEADTSYLRQIADQLEPAAATAAKAAADTARGLAPVCGDPLPGCQAFHTAVVQVADQITTFLTEVEQGIEAYASVARESAGLYADANQTANNTFGSGPWASLR